MESLIKHRFAIELCPDEIGVVGQLYYSPAVSSTDQHLEQFAVVALLDEDVEVRQTLGDIYL